MKQVLLGSNGELAIIQEIEFVEHEEKNRFGEYRIVLRMEREERFYVMYTGEDEMPFMISQKHLDHCEILGEL